MLDAFAPVPTVLGIALVLVTFHDLISTAVSVASGAGPLTGRIGRWSWRLALSISRRFHAPWVLRPAGPLIMFTIMGTWTVLVILGWALVFGQPETVVTVSDGKPTAFLGNIYFASATVTGIGSTTLSTSTDAWQAAEQLAAASGVALLGLSVAYVLPIVQAVVAKRELAAYITSIGDDANEMLLRCWNGRDFGELDLHLIPITADLSALSERYLAYPVLHYFHSDERRTAIGPAVAAVDGVLGLHRHVLAEDLRLEPSVLNPLERALDGFLDTVRSPDIDGVADDPRWPGLDELREAGIDLCVDGDSVPVPDEARERHRRVECYLLHDGWNTESIRSAAV